MHVRVSSVAQRRMERLLWIMNCEVHERSSAICLEGLTKQRELRYGSPQGKTSNPRTLRYGVALLTSTQVVTSYLFIGYHRLNTSRMSSRSTVQLVQWLDHMQQRVQSEFDSWPSSQILFFYVVLRFLISQASEAAILGRNLGKSMSLFK